MTSTQHEETHRVCGKRLAAEGGKAICCDCNPHDDCGPVSPSTQHEGWEAEFDKQFGIYSNYADFCPDGSVYKLFITDLLKAEKGITYEKSCIYCAAGRPHPHGLKEPTS